VLDRPCETRIQRDGRARAGESESKPVLTDGDGTADEDVEAVQRRAIRRGKQFDAIVGATLFGWIGFGGMLAWRVTLLWLFQPLVDAGLPEPVLDPVIVTISFGLGALTVAAVYLRVFDHDLGFIDASWPSLRELGYTLGGVTGVTVVLSGSSRLLQFVGTPEPEYIIVERTADTPELLLVLLVVSVLVVGPGEELLYRNVVQKSLYDAFSRRSAIMIASVIFTTIHSFVYSIALDTPMAVLGTLVALLVFSLGLGWLYSRTGNVVVPAAVHGLYSACQLLLLYVRPGMVG
jgi:membrane protease YdiL (CAAX protease family)